VFSTIVAIAECPISLLDEDRQEKKERINTLVSHNRFKYRTQSKDTFKICTKKCRDIESDNQIEKSLKKTIESYFL